MYKIWFSGILFLLLIISCSDERFTNPKNIQGLYEDDYAEFVFLDKGDPLNGGPSPKAFRIDGWRPLYFWALELSETQKENIRDIGKPLSEKIRNLHAQWLAGDIGWKMIGAERKSIKAAFFDEIRLILTEPQLQVLNSIENDLANGVYPDLIVEKRVDLLSYHLRLDENQQTDVGQLILYYGTQTLLLRNSSDDLIQFRAEMHKLMKEFEETLLEQLSVEQVVLYSALKPQKHNRG